MARIGARRAAVLGIAITGLAAAGAARAQMPPEAAELNSCLCMQQEISRLSAEMAEKMTVLRDTDRRIAALAAQLRRERPDLDVNNPAAVEHYKALLEEHDALRKSAIGPVWAAANDAVARYNARVREYDGSCAHRLFNSVLMRQIQASLTCQAPGYAPPVPAESEYPPAPAYAPPPAPPESEYPPYPGPR
jgi:hypothetical protein